MRKILYILFLVLLSSCSKAQSFDGSWKGEVEVASSKLLLVFNLEKNGDAWKGTLESPMQTSQKFPITSIKIERDSIWIAVNSIKLAYVGFLDRDRDVMKGVMKQGNFESALLLVRSENEQSGITRQQDVFPPYPYEEQEVEITNVKGNSRLTGTLTYPKGKENVPAIVLVNGSGQQNRDSEIFGHRPFKVLADHLTRNGFAVLRYDDRGIGGSKGEVNRATTIDFASDADAAVTLLKNQHAVGISSIGIVGHSEGGLIAAIVASENKNVRYIAMLSGPILRGDSLLILQSYALGKIGGLSEAQLFANKQKNRRIYDILMQDKTPAQIKTAVEQELVRQNGGHAFSSEETAAVSPMLIPWFRTFLKLDPAYYLKRTAIPIFAAFGGKDIQVPANENIYALERLRLKTTAVTIKDYPNLNHLYQDAKTGSVDEYFDNPETLNINMMDDLTTWLKQQARVD